MQKNDKTLEPSSILSSPSALARQQAWTKLTSKYLRDLPQQLDGIRTVLGIKDYDAIKKCAHRIKGTSGTYHLETISRSTAQLERLAETRNPDAIVDSIDKVRRLVELETKRLNSHPPSPAHTSERSGNG
jgi:HPt (histidine-containing phosphotransfer) domain-containing protein